MPISPSLYDTQSYTYGDSGNRWWVGLNVGSDQSTVFGTGSILSPNGYESLPSGNAVDDVKFAAAALINKTGAANTISVENVSWYNINGPYTTQAEANAAIPAIQKAHPAPGAVQQATAGGQSPAANGGGVNFSSVSDALGAFYDAVTDGKRWRSLGWILLGVAMIIVGVALWVKGSLSILPVSSGPEAHLGPVSAPILPLAIIGIGMYLTWFSVAYWDSTTKYPTDPLKNVLQGKGLPSPSGQTPTGTDSNAQVVGNAGSPPDVSGNYTLTSLQALWISQGGSSQTAFEAANIAMAESGGRPAVTSSNPDGGTNVGLWQLDTKGVGAGYTIDQLSDPATNCRITIMNTSNGTNWSEWADSVVVNGRYVGPTS